MLSLCLRTKEIAMTATFLHRRVGPPPDEIIDYKHLSCSACGNPLWLTKVETKVSPKGIEAHKCFECKSCGAVQLQTEHRTDPLPSI